MESVFLAICGGLAGIPLSFALLRLFAVFSPARIPLEQIHVDIIALIFTIACSVMAGILTGLAPAFRARRVDVAMTMAEGSRGSSSGMRQNRLRSALAVSEIALALVLLVGTGLLLRSFVKLTNVSPGFDPSNVLTFAVALPEENYKQPGQVKRLVDTVLEGVRSFNGVTFASAATSLPMGDTEATVFSRIGAPPATAGFKPAAIQIVSHEYLRTFGIRLMRGRSFEAADDNSRRPIALVNEAMMKRYWPDTEVLGKQLYWLVGGRTLTVVGVVADVRQEGLSGPPMPTFYVPLAQSPQANRNLIFAIRTAQPAPGLPLAVRRVVRTADEALPLFSLRSAHEVVNNSVATQRFDMFVVAAFASFALTLSVVGLYSVISYLVVQARSELGVRMALGATPRRILGMVLMSGCRFGAAGILLGTGLALILTRFMRSMLFGVTETDTATFGLVIALLAGVSMLAALVPAIRATKVDPGVSLRL
jgi:putative ABC transport system permease protein